MAELSFFYGTMNCGKSTLALQMAHNAIQAGKHVRLYTRLDRAGAVISSRIGLEKPANQVDDGMDLFEDVRATLKAGTAVDLLICDEVQFYAREHVDELARVVDELDIDVLGFGLLSDFTTHLFEGSARMLEMADRRQELQVEARCWCGARATHNARTIDGVIQRSGETVVVGDLDQLTIDGPGEVAYEVLCRRHHRNGTTAGLAHDGNG